MLVIYDKLELDFIICIKLNNNIFLYVPVAQYIETLQLHFVVAIVVVAIVVETGPLKYIPINNKFTIEISKKKKC